MRVWTRVEAELGVRPARIVASAAARSVRSVTDVNEVIENGGGGVESAVEERIGSDQLHVLRRARRGRSRRPRAEQDGRQSHERDEKPGFHDLLLFVLETGSRSDMPRVGEGVASARAPTSGETSLTSPSGPDVELLTIPLLSEVRLS